MREFFRGWKRKLECMTLVVTCVLMAGWMRSTTTYDRILIHNGKYRADSFDSRDGLIAWGRRHFSDDQEGTAAWSHRPTSSVKEFKVHWKLYVFGDYESFNEDGASHTVLWLVPYWSLILWLTLVSAWLMLSKTSRDGESDA